MELGISRESRYAVESQRKAISAGAFFRLYAWEARCISSSATSFKSIVCSQRAPKVVADIRLKHFATVRLNRFQGGVGLGFLVLDWAFWPKINVLGFSKRTADITALDFKNLRRETDIVDLLR